jgi:MFS transporter, MHS family, proline/betaine transporter
MKRLTSRKQRKVIRAVTIGNILEWFEIYSYAFLVPIFAKKFFHFDKELWNWIASFSLFGIGFFARILGTYFFGHIGDVLGRQKAFILSITMMTIPTFVVGYIPDYSLWGVWAPLVLFFLRLIQSIPAAGESPGTACFLYENSEQHNKIFITSWGAFGNQLGAILGVLETFFVEDFIPESFLMNWGWRISFWLGGFIGLFGIYLRRKLEETPMFKEIDAHHKIDRHSFHTIWKKDKKAVMIGVGYGLINASTFYMLATYIPTYFDSLIGLSKFQNGMISFIILTLSTILLPIFGYLGDKINNRFMLVYSAILIIILTIVIYYLSENQNHLILLAIVACLYIFPITCISALITNLLSELFETPVRFAGVSLTFNIADGLIGGFTPVAALILYKITDKQAAFCWYLLASSIISLYFFAVHFKYRANLSADNI